MDCNQIQDAMFDVLSGYEPEIPIERVREHLAGCGHCREAAPGIARDYVALNQAMMPPDPGDGFWARIEAGLRANGFPLPPPPA